MINDSFVALRQLLKTLCRAGLPAAIAAISLLRCQSAEAEADARIPVPSSEGRLTAFPFWGELSPGPHRVGFRAMFRFDTSRTWRVTRDYAGNYSPDPHGRPVQLNVWYPAGPSVVGRQMTFGSYVDQAAPEEFSALNSIMRGRNLENAKASVAADQLATLLATPVNAFADASPLAGRFPTVLCFGGLNAEVNSNFVLAEFLASHGYVVASISLLGATDQQPSQARTPSDLEAVVRDMEFGWAILGEGMHGDRTKLAVLGHSLGGVEAAMFGLRNGNVLAVIGLDGTYGFKGSAGVLTGSFGYSPGRMRAAFLDMRRAQGEQQAELDLEPVMSFRHSDRWLVTLARMHHSDFTSFAMVGSKFQVPIQPEYVGTGWDRETGRRGYQEACRIVLGFLDDKVKNHLRGADSFRQAIQRAEGNATRVAASYAPLSPREVVALANADGLETVKSLFTKIAGDQPLGANVDANAFNTYGYDLLGQRRPKDAHHIFEIVAWAHPTSANAQDSLADAYLAIGDKQQARRAVQRAIELVPTDPTIGADSKISFLKDEQHRLEDLK